MDCNYLIWLCFFFFFQAEDGIRDDLVTGVQTCAFRSFAGEQKVHRFFEAGIETRQDVLNRLRFDFENAARGVEAHGWPHMTPKSRINRKGTIYRAPMNRQIGGASRWLNLFSSDEPRCLVLSISPTGRGAAPGEERSGRRTKPLRDCHES